MTKKHFVALAASLASTKPDANVDAPEHYAQWLFDARAIADVCASTNARFDRARFLAACGVPAPVGAETTKAKAAGGA